MRLVLASPEQQTERDAVTYSAWGDPLTLQGYLQREQRLRGHPWSRAELKVWLLCAEQGEVLASCETYRMDSFLRATDGTLSPGDSFAIASVFTEERLRGRGYATKLMDLLAAELEHASPRAHSALLFSDVGAPLYRRSGYQETPAWDWRFPPEPGEPSALVDRLLQDTDVAAALARMRRSILGFIEHHDIPREVYHETLTVFWVRRVRAFVSREGRGRTLRELANELARACGDPRLVHEYFSEALIKSEAARVGWVEPDRKPLDF